MKFLNHFFDDVLSCYLRGSVLSPIYDLQPSSEEKQK
jgi:hypothetical protein